MLSDRIAAHIAETPFAALLGQARDMTRLALLDATGVMLGASGLSPETAPFRDLPLASGAGPSLLLGGRADPGAVRSGIAQARVEGVVSTGDLAGFREAVEESGGVVEDDRVVLARNVAAQGRSRAWVGGASVPVTTLAEIAEPLVAVHGQSDQLRLRTAAARACH